MLSGKPGRLSMKVSDVPFKSPSSQYRTHLYLHTQIDRGLNAQEPMAKVGANSANELDKPEVLQKISLVMKCNVLPAFANHEEVLFGRERNAVCESEPLH